MGYLKDFQRQIAARDYTAFLRLWEEYCLSDEIEPRELEAILKEAKISEFALPFGKHVETILTLWDLLPPTEEKHKLFKQITDLQTTNHEPLRQKIFAYLQERYGANPHFQEFLKITGLRNKESFQGAVSNFELLHHLVPGHFVFHTGGWGVGEIVEVSLMREEVTSEFDYVSGKKSLSFENAFKYLVPIPSDHFLAMRFGAPDELEKRAKAHPGEVIRMLLRDLGPKTAAEMKDELAELVIPEAEWVKWWQSARSKIKKDTMIEVPDDLRSPFKLRSEGVSHEETFCKALENTHKSGELLSMTYTFLRDFPETLKDAAFKDKLITSLKGAGQGEDLTEAQKLSFSFLLEDLSGSKGAAHEIVVKSKSFEALVQSLDILAFKKRALSLARKGRADWHELFLNLFFTAAQNPIRDFILESLTSGEKVDEFKKRLEELWIHPGRHPELFMWYFQKLMGGDEILFSDPQGKLRFFEGFFVLLSHLENAGTHKDLIKKMHALLIGERFLIVREVLKGADLPTAQEFLLLASKCHSLSDHDLKILHSLAEVVHPKLGKLRKKQEGSSEGEVLWTTEEGYAKVKGRIQQIATVETVENAKEIEVARSHGDLRENAEFKAALERRSRLQSELKSLSDQVNRARILTKADVSTEEVGVGTVVRCENSKGEEVSYSLLGPWEADPERNILSMQSKLAQALKGLIVGDTVQIQGEPYTVTHIGSIF